MEQQQIQALTASFEGQQTENGVEYWLARDLQHPLGYGKWDNFQRVIAKAKTACELSAHVIADHFPGVGKMIELPPSGAAIRSPSWSAAECGANPTERQCLSN